MDKALAWLRDSVWVAVPADKDGTFTLVGRETSSYLIHLKLKDKCYHPVADHVANHEYLQCRSLFQKVGAQLAKLGLKKWAREVSFCFEESKPVL